MSPAASRNTGRSEAAAGLPAAQGGREGAGVVCQRRRREGERVRWGREGGRETRPRDVDTHGGPKGRKDRPTQYFLPVLRAICAPWSNAVSPLVFIGQVLTSSSFVFSPRGVVQEGFQPRGEPV